MTTHISISLTPWSNNHRISHRCFLQQHFIYSHPCREQLKLSNHAAIITDKLTILPRMESNQIQLLRTVVLIPLVTRAILNSTYVGSSIIVQKATGEIGKCWIWLSSQHERIDASGRV